MMLKVTQKKFLAKNSLKKQQLDKKPTKKIFFITLFSPYNKKKSPFYLHKLTFTNK